LPRRYAIPFISQGKTRSNGSLLNWDMEKVFDRIRWELLEALMIKMAFHKTWIGWNLACIQSSRIHFIVNNYSTP